MTDDNPHTSSLATRAVQALVAQSVEQLKQNKLKSNDDALLYLGNWHDALPRVLIQDPVLEPADKIVWQVIKLETGERSSTAFPNYQRIGSLANIKSKATIARAIAILRASRWLTLCRRVRDEATGQWRGNIYALHDEPLTLAETLELDSDYMQFLYQSKNHAHSRVRQVTQAVLRTIDNDIAQGVDLEQPVSAIERRADALETLHNRTNGEINNDSNTNGGHYFAFDMQALSGLQGVRLVGNATESTSTPVDNDESVDKYRVQNMNPVELSTDESRVQNMNLVNTTDHRVQNMNPVTTDTGLADESTDSTPKSGQCSGQVQNLNPTVQKMNLSPVVVSSSKSTTTGKEKRKENSGDLNTQTNNQAQSSNTATKQANNKAHWKNEPLNPDLHFPIPQLSNNQCLLIQMYIGRHGFDLETQQDILDELAGVHNNYLKHGGKPINNPVAWVNRVCTLIKEDGFNLSLGLDIRDRRERDSEQAQQAELWSKRTGTDHKMNLPPANPNNALAQRVLAIQNKKRD